MEDIVLREQQRYQLQGYLRVLDCLTEQIHDVDGRVRKTCKLSAEAKLLLGVPGIGPLSALVILAELGDISRFPTAEHAVSFARLAPSVLLLRGKTRHGQTGSERPPLGAD